MSSRTTGKREIRKIPPPEAILTRNKLSQIKRRLRNTDKSMKRISQITKLLQSPTREKDPPIFNKRSRNRNKLSKKECLDAGQKKTKEIASKNNKKNKMGDADVAGNVPGLFVVEKESKFLVKRAEGEDFVPEKVKRGRRRRKVVLKPSTGTKIAGCKRKMAVPLKDGTSAKPAKRPKLSPSSPIKGQASDPPVSGQSLGSPPDDREDLESLTEEDLLEILTCESPVWWEEAPGEGYSEEAIFCRKPPSLDSVTTSKRKAEAPVKIRETPPQSTALEITNAKLSDRKFMQKRSKLENLLGNIKNLHGKPKNCGKVDLDRPQIIKEVDKSVEEHDPIEQLSEIKTNSVKDGEKVDQKDDKDGKLTDPDVDHHKSIAGAAVKLQNNDKATEESSESDDIFLLPYDDMLKDFENMQIPIEGEKKEQNHETIVLDDSDTNLDDIETFLITNKVISEPDTVTDSSVSEKGTVDVITKETVKVVEMLKSPPRPQKMVITSIEKEFSSPISTKSSILSDTTDTTGTNAANTDYLDTISDTNIKFVNEDDSSDRNSIVEEIVQPQDYDSAIPSVEISKCGTEIMETAQDQNSLRTNENSFVKYTGGEEITHDVSTASANEKSVEKSSLKSADDDDGIRENQKRCVIKTNSILENTKDHSEVVRADDSVLDAKSSLEKSLDNDSAKSENSATDSKPSVKNTKFSKLKQVYKELCSKELSKETGNVARSLLRDKCDVTNEKKEANNRTEEITSDRKLPNQLQNVTKTDNDIGIPVKNKEIDGLSMLKGNNISQDDNTKINSFYKKCKNSTQRRSKNNISLLLKNIKPETEESTKVIETKSNAQIPSDSRESERRILCDTVKYCLKCSSIFDTETCGYCLRKTKFSADDKNGKSNL